MGGQSYPNLAEMLAWFMAEDEVRPRAARAGCSAYQEEFEFGLDLVLDGLERSLPKATRRPKRR